MGKPIGKIVGTGRNIVSAIPYVMPYFMLCNLPIKNKYMVYICPSFINPITINANPNNIKIETKQKRRFQRISFAWSGDWDIDEVRPRCSIFNSDDSKSPFQRDFDTVRDMFILGLKPSETREYKDMLHSLLRGGQPRGCTNEQEIDEYFERLSRVYKAMATTGYTSAVSRGEFSRDEISVWITRHGCLAYGGWGNHRLAMAEHLSITRIPVVVLGAHPQWLLQLCDSLKAPPHRAVRQWAEQQLD